MKQALMITAVWSRCIGDDIETLVEVNNKWYRCITERGDNFSHIAECRGALARWPLLSAEDAEAKP